MFQFPRRLLLSVRSGIFVRPTSELKVKVFTSRTFRVTKRLRMEKSAWTGGKEPATIVLLVVSVVKHLQ